MASSARIDELRKKFEENPRRYFAPLANEYRKAGDVDQAIAICREYLPQQPGHMSGHIVYGQALYEGREFEEAKGVFETALSLDPENLIALRHLGDIALILGDTEGAKSWYGRVLEADPRNEEIQAQLKSLDAVTPANATTAETPATQTAVPEPAASSAPTVVVSAMKAPVIERTVEQPAMSVPPEKPVNQVETLGSAPTAEITLDNVPSPDIPALENLESLSLPDSPAVVGEAPAGLAPTASSEPAAPVDRLELDTAVPEGSGTVPAIDSFTLEGLETTSMTPESASGLSSTPESESALSFTPESESLLPSTPEPMSMWEGTSETLPGRSELTIEESQEMVVDLGTPESVQAQEIQSESPSGIDALDLGLPASEPASSPEGSALASPAEGSVPASPTADLPMIDVSDSPEPSATQQAQDQAQDAAREPGPFVTETMAELYLSQGHREEALRVYRALVEQRPDDAALRAKLDRMQADAGPTIRELLARVASRRPGQRPPATATPADSPALSRTEGVAPAGQDNSASVDAQPPQAVVESPQPSPAAREGAEVRAGDAIAGFLNAPAPSGDAERAAIVLASAFASAAGSNGHLAPQDASGIGGSPARPASKDLSLDAVFGETPAQPQAAANFSFDQFFRPPAGGGSSSGSAPGQGQEARDDIAKFTQWLEGLKQR